MPEHTSPLGLLNLTNRDPVQLYLRLAQISSLRQRTKYCLSLYLLGHQTLSVLLHLLVGVKEEENKSENME